MHYNTSHEEDMTLQSFEVRDLSWANLNTESIDINAKFSHYPKYGELSLLHVAIKSGLLTPATQEE